MISSAATTPRIVTGALRPSGSDASLTTNWSAEIVEDLQAALDQFAQIAADLASN
jgi:hypothetical protein